MSNYMSKILEELIERFHLPFEKKEESSPDDKPGLPMEDKKLTPDADQEAENKEDPGSEDQERMEALKNLAGEKAGHGVGGADDQESQDQIEEMKPALKHNHSVIKEVCGPGCPMHDSQAK